MSTNESVPRSEPKPKLTGAQRRLHGGALVQRVLYQRAIAMHEAEQRKPPVDRASRTSMYAVAWGGTARLIRRIAADLRTTRNGATIPEHFASARLSEVGRRLRRDMVWTALFGGGDGQVRPIGRYEHPNTNANRRENARFIALTRMRRWVGARALLVVTSPELPTITNEERQEWAAAQEQPATGATNQLPYRGGVRGIAQVVIGPGPNPWFHSRQDHGDLAEEPTGAIPRGQPRG